MVEDGEDGGRGVTHEVDGKAPRQLEDRFSVMLQRQWSLIETLKSYRAQFPFYVAFLLISTTAFLIGTDDAKFGGAQAARRIMGIGMVTCVLIAASAFWAVYLLRRRYLIVDERINHLYERLHMDTDDFFPGRTEEERSVSRRKNKNTADLFLVAYAAIAVVTLACVTALWIARP